MLINERKQLASILQVTADVLDIPDYVYQEATLKYEDIAEHLAAEDSVLRQYEPEIYPQGSFRLGTVVHPYGRGDEYDIDLVCQLKIKKEAITQSDLKSRIGLRLKARQDLAKIIEPSRRCWVLSYPADGTPAFHMDVLPSIPNAERQPTGILLTDTELTRWQKSNPIAYAEWFRQRMQVIFKLRKAALAESLRVSIEQVPDWRVKTPLQRCVQILKRHRDIYFQQKPEVRPVSITLTTLAAHSYQNQEDIFDALTVIAKRMPSFIENRDGKWWVPNPTDPDENFADKWNEYPERREAFMQWLKQVEADFANVSRAETLPQGLTWLDKSLGRETMNKVATALGVPRPNLSPIVLNTIPAVPVLADARHAQVPQWPLLPRYHVAVSVGVHRRRGGKKLWTLGRESVPKKIWLRFEAQTDAPEPYAVRWQVVNTGQEAINAGQPRGDFYEDSDKHVRWETTAYRGTHWVEAFILKGGVCVARSGRVLVPIR